MNTFPVGTAIMLGTLVALTTAWIVILLIQAWNE